MPDTEITEDMKRNILELARKRYKSAMEADAKQREEALKDLQFIEGDQWPEDMKKKREAQKRPCLVLDRLNEKVAQVIGDIRQNKIGIVVSPVDDKGDVEVAASIEDVIRHIENNSDAEVAYDTASESSARCGRGFLRVITEYADDESFDQDIKIKRISNCFAVLTDPSAEEADHSDAKYKFVTQMIEKEEYEQKYPGKTPASVDDTGGDESYDFWFEGERIRIAEYWLKVPDSKKKKTVYQIETTKGKKKIVEKVPKGATVLKKRLIQGEKVIRYIIDGKNILEGPNDWSGIYIPIIPVLGEELHLGDRKVLRGLVRLARDPQMMMNFWESMITEQVGLQPKVPWLCTPAMTEGNEDAWNRAHEDNFSVLYYKPDPDAPTLKPERPSPPAISTGIENRIQVNADHIKSATRIYDAAVGAPSAEKSGVAIRERKIESDIGTYVFGDNLKRSMRHLGRVLVDLIPRIYDTERIKRIRGVDGEVKTIYIANAGEGKKKIKSNNGKEEYAFDLSVGKYDVTVEAGPTFTTQRQEANAAMMEILKALPETFNVFGDLWVKSQDWHEADEIAERCKYILLPEIQAKLREESEEGEESPEVAEALKTAMQEPGAEQMMAEEGAGAGGEAQQTEIDQYKVVQERLKVLKMKYEAQAARLKLSQLAAEVGIDPDRAPQEGVEQGFVDEIEEAARVEGVGEVEEVVEA